MNESLAMPATGETEILPPTHEITVPEPKTLEAMFSKPAEIDKLLERLAKAARAHKPDLSTDTGRKAVASVAYKVSRSKTALDNAGKALTEEWRRSTALVNNERKKIEAFLDNLRDEVRKPLTDWEDAEKARVEALQERVRSSFVVPPAGASAAELRQRLEAIEAIELDDSWAEYVGDAERGKLQAVMALRPALAAAEKAEADAAELEKLRAEIDKRQAADERRKAKEKAEREKAEAEEREKHRLAQIEADKKLAADQAVAREREAAAIKAKREKEAADQLEAKLRAEAVEAEDRARKKLEAEQRQAEEERRQREADEELRTLARARIVKALVLSVGEKFAETVADLIIAGRVPHVRFEP